MLDYYCYRLQMRVNETNPLLCGGRVFQQYIVDQWTKIEQNNLNYLKNNQSKLRVETRKNVEAAAADGADAPTTGKPYTLPSSFVGSKRYMCQQYQDAMAIVRALGKPDLFITFTCNPPGPKLDATCCPVKSRTNALTLCRASSKTSCASSRSTSSRSMRWGA